MATFAGGSKHLASEELAHYLDELLQEEDDRVDTLPKDFTIPAKEERGEPNAVSSRDNACPNMQLKPQQATQTTITRQLPEVLLPLEVFVPPLEELQKTAASPELDTVTKLQQLQKASQAKSVITRAQPSVPVTPVDQGRPGWAENPFECLLFQVAGLKLAVPLITLGGVYVFNDSVTPLFGQPDWFLGVYKHRDQSLYVVDTAWWIMPERYTPATHDGYQYIISIEGSPWGMAVSDLANAVKILPEAVKWRSNLTKRPWLAGTVVDEMCALLDIAKLAKLLEEQDVAQNIQRFPKK